MGDSKGVARIATQLNYFMASHDTEFRTLRATSQENTVHIQKLNEELRKLRDRIDRENSITSGTKRDESKKPKG